jgi:membrane protein
MNTIWRVTRPRSFYVRLRTFTMVTVYSPVLLIASFQARVWSKILPASLHAFDVLPFILNVLAFAMLIWFAPNTRVRFKNAFWGALVAAGLFEIERQGFSQYVRFSFQTQAIYGTFGVAVFFLISLILVSVFILFGAQVAYVMQNFRPLLRTRRRGERRVAGHVTYLGMRMLLDIIAAFRNHTAPPSAAMLERKYELTNAQAAGILDPLIKAGLVHRVNDSEAFVPAIDFTSRLAIEVIDLYEEQNRAIPAVPADTVRDRLSDIIARLKYHSDPVLQSVTFGQLLREIETTVVRVDALKKTQ